MKEVAELSQILKNYTARDARNDAIRVWAKENNRKYASAYAMANRMEEAARAGHPIVGRDIPEVTTVPVATTARRPYNRAVKPTFSSANVAGELRIPIKTLNVVDGNLVITF